MEGNKSITIFVHKTEFCIFSLNKSSTWLVKSTHLAYN